MVTLTTRVPEPMAQDVYRAADMLKLSGSDELVFEAVRLFLQSTLPTRRGRPYKFKPVGKRR